MKARPRHSNTGLILAIAGLFLLWLSSCEVAPDTTCQSAQDCFSGEVCSNGLCSAPITVSFEQEQCDLAPCTNEHTEKVVCLGDTCEAISCRQGADFCGATCCVPEVMSSSPPKTNSIAIDASSGNLPPLDMVWNPRTEQMHFFTSNPDTADIIEITWEDGEWQQRAIHLFPKALPVQQAFSAAIDAEGVTYLAYLSAPGNLSLAQREPGEGWSVEEVFEFPNLEEEAPRSLELRLDPTPIIGIEFTNAELLRVYRDALPSSRMVLWERKRDNIGELSWQEYTCIENRENTHFFSPIAWKRDGLQYGCMGAEVVRGEDGQLLALNTVFTASFVVDGLSEPRVTRISRDNVFSNLEGDNHLWYDEEDQSWKALFGIARFAEETNSLVASTYPDGMTEPLPLDPIVTGLPENQTPLSAHSFVDGEGKYWLITNIFGGNQSKFYIVQQRGERPVPETPIDFESLEPILSLGLGTADFDIQGGELHKAYLSQVLTQFRLTYERVALDDLEVAP